MPRVPRSIRKALKPFVRFAGSVTAITRNVPAFEAFVIHTFSPFKIN